MLTLKVARGVDSEKARVFAARLLARPHCFSAIKLTINDNRSSLVSAKPSRNGQTVPALSVHWSFFDCDDRVLDALLGMLTENPETEHGRVLRYYIDRYHTSLHGVATETQTDITQEELIQIRERAMAQALRHINLCSRGLIYDLHRMMNEMNEEFFEGKLNNLRVTWMTGVRPLDRRRRGVVFGNYDARLNLIRVNPCLDTAQTPDYFLRFVLYHEMLHSVLDPPRRPGKRHVVHTARFRMLEKRFPQYAKAKNWEAEFVRSL